MNSFKLFHVIFKDKRVNVMKYKNNDTIEIRMLDFLEEEFPVPCFENTDKYEVGTILNTKVRYRTNATILEVNYNFIYTVVTDIGNVILVTEKELKQWYKKPKEKRLKVYVNADS